MLSRRHLLALAPAAATGLFLSRADRPVSGLVAELAAQTPPAGPFSLPPLPYAVDALEPHVDAQTMTIHHDRHHQGYVTNLNAAVANRPDLRTRTLEDLIANLDRLPDDVRTAIRNNGGGHLNHSWFWTSMKKGGGRPPSAELGRAIDAGFGSLAQLQERLAVAAVGVFGSGWAWLSVDATGALVVETTPNQDNPLTRGHRPVLGIDVWEHAYYLKYQNRRRDYVDAFFNVVDWDIVQERWQATRT
ncbi:MAG: superoxide dismutase [Acidobacteria bacterium]|nr:superoxide dismutase [Acidobacteriota bacterium]